ncbi:hypothetical protein PR048_005446 [Dryococelus australis]|uniref:Uncharacterized protein n=1 Tax=Dryococelus australis TaxID=614101 RepID=A0ABQ9I897_9NEOP|nr:hypothetical protein PR048_005446 [Dryococelus australis]
MSRRHHVNIHSSTKDNVAASYECATSSGNEQESTHRHRCRRLVRCTPEAADAGSVTGRPGVDEPGLHKTQEVSFRVVPARGRLLTSSHLIIVHSEEIFTRQSPPCQDKHHLCCVDEQGMFTQNTSDYPAKLRLAMKPRFGVAVMDKKQTQHVYAGRCRLSSSILADLSFPPSLHSGTAPFSLHFTLIETQELVRILTMLEVSCKLTVSKLRHVATWCCVLPPHVCLFMSELIGGISELPYQLVPCVWFPFAAHPSLQAAPQHKVRRREFRILQRACQWTTSSYPHARILCIQEFSHSPAELCVFIIITPNPLRTAQTTRFPPRRTGFDIAVESLPDFNTWESCRRMPLVGGFSRRFPTSPHAMTNRAQFPTVNSRFSHAGNESDIAVDHWVFSSCSCFPNHCIALLLCHSYFGSLLPENWKGGGEGDLECEFLSPPRPIKVRLGSCQGTCWHLHPLELSRMLFEPVLDIRRAMVPRIILLDHPIVVRKTDVHVRLQMVTKESFVAVTIEFCGYKEKWTQLIPCEHTPHFYGTTTSMHGALLTTGFHGLLGLRLTLTLPSVLNNLYRDSSDQATCFKSSRVQLATSRVQVRRCARLLTEALW